MASVGAFGRACFALALFLSSSVPRCRSARFGRMRRRSFFPRFASSLFSPSALVPKGRCRQSLRHGPFSSLLFFSRGSVPGLWSRHCLRSASSLSFLGVLGIGRVTNGAALSLFSCFSSQVGSGTEGVASAHGLGTAQRRHLALGLLVLARFLAPLLLLSKALILLHNSSKYLQIAQHFV